MGSELKFFKHIGNIVARTHVRANLIHKCFLSRDVQTLTRGFTVYVRLLLEYGSCVWSPHFKSEIDRIESVQRRFTKWLRVLNNMSHSQRLISLDLESLEVRRLRQDLLLAYKIVFDLININSSKFSTLLRRHSFTLFLSHSRVDVRKYFIVSGKWNYLHACDDHFRSITTFKRFYIPSISRNCNVIFVR